VVRDVQAIQSAPAEASLPATWSDGALVAGTYEVKGVVGTGGTSVVVAAVRRRDGLHVALKLPKQPELLDVVMRRRLEREARSASRLTGEHVARILDVGTLDDGTPFLVMERLQGQDLKSVLRERGKVPVATAARWLLQACDAVKQAHALGIVHRDIKPSNLFLCTDATDRETIKVLDFGLAKAFGAAITDDSTLTGSSAVVGTPRYLPPEVVRDVTAADPRCDVWSLGVVLHELVAGRSPFDAPTACGVLARIVADPPEPLASLVPDPPPELLAALAGALQKDPARRTASVEAFARQLEPLVATGVARVPRSTPRRRVAAAVLGAALIVAAGSALFGGSDAVVPLAPAAPQRPVLSRHTPPAVPATAGPVVEAAAAAPVPVRPPARDRTIRPEPSPVSARPSSAPPRAAREERSARVSLIDGTVDTRK
jgi:serine/threonine-protein kinase